MSVKYLLLIFMICFASAVFAQKQNVYFLKNDGTKVSTRDSADYIRVISPPDSADALFNVKEYYKSGNIKFTGKSSESDRCVLEGVSISYYPSGVREQIMTYTHGKLIGDIYDYYPNGVLYTRRGYLPDRMHSSNNMASSIFIIASNDTTGKPMVINGTGHYVVYEENFEDINFRKIREEGDVKEGVKEGHWKGNHENNTDTVAYTEVFEKGILVSGESRDKKGSVFTYKNTLEKPQFVGGEEAFGKFLRNNIRYPEDAHRTNTEGSVFIQFVVEKDGTLSNFKILRDPGRGLGNEAIRVLKISPKWIPGLVYGQPGHVQYTVPVNFSIGN